MYRNPGLVAKMATTVNHISHGRFVLGIGTAWFKREHDAYGWAGAPMTAETFHHKASVLNAHCERVGRDPSEIKHTVLILTMVSDDTEKASALVNGRRLGSGSETGRKNYVVDMIGEIVAAGADGRMICGIPTDDIEQYQLVAEEVLSHF